MLTIVCLKIAAMYNALDGLIYVSTIPRGERAGQMAELHSLTPGWSGAATAYATKTRYYCAEDAVLFNVESAQKEGTFQGKCRNLLSSPASRY